MAQFVKGKSGYYYKVFNNGKKVRISKDDYIKSTYKSSAGSPTYPKPLCAQHCERKKITDILKQKECLRRCWNTLHNM